MGKQYNTRGCSITSKVFSSIEFNQQQPSVEQQHKSLLFIFFKINLCHMTSFSAKAHKASDCTWMSCVPGLHMIEIIASLDSTGIKQKELDHHGLKTNQRSTYWP